MIMYFINPHIFSAYRKSLKSVLSARLLLLNEWHKYGTCVFFPYRTLCSSCWNYVWVALSIFLLERHEGHSISTAFQKFSINSWAAWSFKRHELLLSSGFQNQISAFSFLSVLQYGPTLIWSIHSLYFLEVTKCNIV